MRDSNPKGREREAGGAGGVSCSERRKQAKGPAQGGRLAGAQRGQGWGVPRGAPNNKAPIY